MGEWRSRIASLGGCIFRAKRWFYANYYTPFVKTKDEKAIEVAEYNKRVWATIARSIINALDEKGFDRADQTLAGRVRIEYDEEPIGLVTNTETGQVTILKKIKPLSIVVEVFKKQEDVVVEVPEKLIELEKVEEVEKEVAAGAGEEAIEEAEAAEVAEEKVEEEERAEETTETEEVEATESKESEEVTESSEEVGESGS